MSEYKRLTYKANGITYSKALTQEQLLHRLAGLEDKIESGTLVEENKFYIQKSYRNHDDQRYRIVEFVENEHYDGLTLEQAEARLKELQDKEDCP